jgi:alkanesulfonate monooxygenase SsuD/methylene tetrahydromethanopterin reductase-like flavin-dependent oxidoreductase (luciferase family)
MKVNLGLGPQNSRDTERFHGGRFDEPMLDADWGIIEQTLALGDLAEPLGFDGIWAPEHFASPYGMTPNALQLLAYFAGRTERISLGSMVVVTPWWHPVRLAHQIAYLDILSNGRYDTIGLGRGVAKREFEAVGVPREESRERFDETLEILTLALTQERFAYEGEIYKIPETSIRPQPKSRDLPSRFYGAAATPGSLELNARRGMRPLFVGNKPISKAAEEVRQVNIFRKEEGLPPTQPKNVLFMYCTRTDAEAKQAEQYIAAANRDVSLHYGFGDPSNFLGVKGYESYAARQGYATAASTGSTGYDQSNLLIGPPDEVYRRIEANQQACSFSEITLVPAFGDMPLAEAHASVRLFAQEVLPAVHRMAAPLHAAVLPEGEVPA